MKKNGEIKIQLYEEHRAESISPTSHHKNYKISI